MFWYTLAITIVYGLIALDDIAEERDGKQALKLFVHLALMLPYVYLLFIL